jgi:hypothetical protein
MIHKNSQSYEQNSRSAVYDIDASNNKYRVTPLEENNSNPLMKCHKTVVKYSNKKFLTQGAVSGKSRIARLKYNTKLIATAGNAENGRLISVQGTGHHIRPPYRNNKYIDSGTNVDCSQKGSLKGGVLGTSRLRCGNNLTSRGAANRKAFDFAKTQTGMIISNTIPVYNRSDGTLIMYNSNSQQLLNNNNISNTIDINQFISGTTSSGTTSSDTTSSGTTSSGTTSSGTTSSDTTSSDTTSSGTTSSGTTSSGTTSSGTTSSDTTSSDTTSSDTTSSGTTSSGTTSGGYNY